MAGRNGPLKVCKTLSLTISAEQHKVAKTLEYCGVAGTRDRWMFQPEARAAQNRGAA